MKNRTIFSYDKKPQCEYCTYMDTDTMKCTLGLPLHPCEKFHYDVFKRVPHKSPALPEFDADDFTI